MINELQHAHVRSQILIQTIPTFIKKKWIKREIVTESEREKKGERER